MINGFKYINESLIKKVKTQISVKKNDFGLKPKDPGSNLTYHAPQEQF